MAINIQTGLMDEAVTQGGYYTDLTEYFSSVPEIARPFLRNAKVTLSKIEEMLCKGFGRAFGFSRPITRELFVEFINYHFTILIYRFIGTGQRRRYFAPFFRSVFTEILYSYIINI